MKKLKLFALTAVALMGVTGVAAKQAIDTNQNEIPTKSS